MTRKNNNNFEINRTKSSVACMLAITILLLGATSVAQANDGDFEQSNPVEDAWTPAIQPNIYSEIESESGGTFSEEEILQFLDDVMNNGDSGYSELDGVTDSLGNVLMLHSYDDGVFISTYKEDNQSIALKWEIPLTDCELESMSMETNEHGVFLAMNCYDYAGDEIQIFQITFASGPVLLTTYSAQPSAHFNNVEIVTIDGSLGVFWDEEYFSGSRLMATSAPLPSLTQWDTPVELLSDTYEFHGQIEVFPVEDSYLISWLSDQDIWGVNAERSEHVVRYVHTSDPYDLTGNQRLTETVGTESGQKIHSVDGNPAIFWISDASYSADVEEAIELGKSIWYSVWGGDEFGIPSRASSPTPQEMSELTFINGDNNSYIIYFIDDSLQLKMVNQEVSDGFPQISDFQAAIRVTGTLTNLTYPAETPSPVSLSFTVLNDGDVALDIEMEPSAGLHISTNEFSLEPMEMKTIEVYADFDEPGTHYYQVTIEFFDQTVTIPVSFLVEEVEPEIQLPPPPVTVVEDAEPSTSSYAFLILIASLVGGIVVGRLNKKKGKKGDPKNGKNGTMGKKGEGKSKLVKSSKSTESDLSSKAIMMVVVFLLSAMSPMLIEEAMATSEPTISLFDEVTEYGFSPTFLSFDNQSATLAQLEIEADMEEDVMMPSGLRKDVLKTSMLRWTVQTPSPVSSMWLKVFGVSSEFGEVPIGIKSTESSRTEWLTLNLTGQNIGMNPWVELDLSETRMFQTQGTYNIFLGSAGLNAENWSSSDGDQFGYFINQHPSETSTLAFSAGTKFYNDCDCSADYFMENGVDEPIPIALASQELWQPINDGSLNAPLAAFEYVHNTILSLRLEVEGESLPINEISQSSNVTLNLKLDGSRMKQASSALNGHSRWAQVSVVDLNNNSMTEVVQQFELNESGFEYEYNVLYNYSFDIDMNSIVSQYPALFNGNGLYAFAVAVGVPVSIDVEGSPYGPFTFDKYGLSDDNSIDLSESSTTRFIYGQDELIKSLSYVASDDSWEDNAIYILDIDGDGAPENGEIDGYGLADSLSGSPDVRVVMSVDDLLLLMGSDARGVTVLNSHGNNMPIPNSMLQSSIQKSYPLGHWKFQADESNASGILVDSSLALNDINVSANLQFTDVDNISTLSESELLSRTPRIHNNEGGNVFSIENLTELSIPLSFKSVLRDGRESSEELYCVMSAELTYASWSDKPDEVECYRNVNSAHQFRGFGTEENFNYNIEMNYSLTSADRIGSLISLTGRSGEELIQIEQNGGIYSVSIPDSTQVCRLETSISPGFASLSVSIDGGVVNLAVNGLAESCEYDGLQIMPYGFLLEGPDGADSELQIEELKIEYSESQSEAFTPKDLQASLDWSTILVDWLDESGSRMISFNGSFMGGVTAMNNPWSEHQFEDTSIMNHLFASSALSASISTDYQTTPVYSGSDLSSEYMSIPSDISLTSNIIKADYVDSNLARTKIMTDSAGRVVVDQVHFGEGNILLINLDAGNTEEIIPHIFESLPQKILKVIDLSGQNTTTVLDSISNNGIYSDADFSVITTSQLNMNQLLQTSISDLIIVSGETIYWPTMNIDDDPSSQSNEVGFDFQSLALGTSGTIQDVAKSPSQSSQIQAPSEIVHYSNIPEAPPSVSNVLSISPTLTNTISTPWLENDLEILSDPTFTLPFNSYTAPSTKFEFSMWVYLDQGWNDGETMILNTDPGDLSEAESMYNSIPIISSNCKKRMLYNKFLNSHGSNFLPSITATKTGDVLDVQFTAIPAFDSYEMCNQLVTESDPLSTYSSITPTQGVSFEDVEYGWAKLTLSYGLEGGRHTFTGTFNSDSTEIVLDDGSVGSEKGLGLFKHSSRGQFTLGDDENTVLVDQLTIREGESIVDAGSNLQALSKDMVSQFGSWAAVNSNTFVMIDGPAINELSSSWTVFSKDMGNFEVDLVTPESAPLCIVDSKIYYRECSGGEASTKYVLLEPDYNTVPICLYDDLSHGDNLLMQVEYLVGMDLCAFSSNIENGWNKVVYAYADGLQSNDGLLSWCPSNPSIATINYQARCDNGGVSLWLLQSPVSSTGLDLMFGDELPTIYSDDISIILREPAIEVVGETLDTQTGYRMSEGYVMLRNSCIIMLQNLASAGELVSDCESDDRLFTIGSSERIDGISGDSYSISRMMDVKLSATALIFSDDQFTLPESDSLAKPGALNVFAVPESTSDDKEVLVNLVSLDENVCSNSEIQIDISDHSNTLDITESGQIIPATVDSQVIVEIERISSCQGNNSEVVENSTRFVQMSEVGDYFEYQNSSDLKLRGIYLHLSTSSAMSSHYAINEFSINGQSKMDVVLKNATGYVSPVTPSISEEYQPYSHSRAGQPFNIGYLGNRIYTLESNSSMEMSFSAGIIMQFFKQNQVLWTTKPSSFEQIQMVLSDNQVEYDNSDGMQLVFSSSFDDLQVNTTSLLDPVVAKDGIAPRYHPQSQTKLIHSMASGFDPIIVESNEENIEFSSFALLHTGASTFVYSDGVSDDFITDLQTKSEEIDLQLGRIGRGEIIIVNLSFTNSILENDLIQLKAHSMMGFGDNQLLSIKPVSETDATNRFGYYPILVYGGIAAGTFSFLSEVTRGETVIQSELLDHSDTFNVVKEVQIVDVFSDSRVGVFEGLRTTVIYRNPSPIQARYAVDVLYVQIGGSGSFTQIGVDYTDCGANQICELKVNWRISENTDSRNYFDAGRYISHITFADFDSSFTTREVGNDGHSLPHISRVPNVVDVAGAGFELYHQVKFIFPDIQNASWKMSTDGGFSWTDYQSGQEFITEELTDSHLIKWNQLPSIEDYLAVAQDKRDIVVSFSNPMHSGIYLNYPMLDACSEFDDSRKHREMKLNAEPQTFLDGDYVLDNGRCIVWHYKELKGQSEVRINPASLSTLNHITFSPSNMFREIELGNILLADGQIQTSSNSIFSTKGVDNERYIYHDEGANEYYLYTKSKMIFDQYLGSYFFGGYLNTPDVYASVSTSPSLDLDELTSAAFHLTEGENFIYIAIKCADSSCNMAGFLDGSNTLPISLRSGVKGLSGYLDPEREIRPDSSGDEGRSASPVDSSGCFTLHGVTSGYQCPFGAGKDPNEPTKLISSPDPSNISDAQWTEFIQSIPIKSASIEFATGAGSLLDKIAFVPGAIAPVLGIDMKMTFLDFKSGELDMNRVTKKVTEDKVSISISLADIKVSTSLEQLKGSAAVGAAKNLAGNGTDDQKAIRDGSFNRKDDAPKKTGKTEYDISVNFYYRQSITFSTELPGNLNDGLFEDNSKTSTFVEERKMGGGIGLMISKKVQFVIKVKGELAISLGHTETNEYGFSEQQTYHTQMSRWDISIALSLSVSVDLSWSYVAAIKMIIGSQFPALNQGLSKFKNVLSTIDETQTKKIDKKQYYKERNSQFGVSKYRAREIEQLSHDIKASKAERARAEKSLNSKQRSMQLFSSLVWLTSMPEIDGFLSVEATVGIKVSAQINVIHVTANTNRGDSGTSNSESGSITAVLIDLSIKGWFKITAKGTPGFKKRVCIWKCWTIDIPRTYVEVVAINAKISWNWIAMLKVRGNPFNIDSYTHKSVYYRGMLNSREISTTMSELTPMESQLKSILNSAVPSGSTSGMVKVYFTICVACVYVDKGDYNTNPRKLHLYYYDLTSDYNGKVISGNYWEIQTRIHDSSID